MEKRVFIAINLPQNVKDSLARDIDVLKNKDTDGVVNWVDPDLLHLTLNFLGNIDEPRIGAVNGVLSIIVPQYQSFALETDGLGTFPEVGDPRVIFVKVPDIAGMCPKIQQGLGEGLTKNGFVLTDRPFRAHVTIGRVRDGHTFQLPQVIFNRQIFNVASLDIMASELTPNGPKYTLIEKFHLRS